MSIDLENFYDFLRSRHSVREFQDKTVPEGAVSRMLEGACRAPSAHNRQPWRFVVLGTAATRRTLVESMAQRFKTDLEGDGLPPGEVQARVERSRRRLLAAPVLVLICTTMEGMDFYPDERRKAAERQMAVQSTALAAGHLLLAAHAEGLAACWMCAPLFAADAVRQGLDLPEGWEPQAFVAIGVPAGSAQATERKPVDEVTLWG